MIECSNLRRQLENELEDFRALQKIVGSGGSRQQRKRFAQLAPDVRIREEMRYKCIHSLLILHRLGESVGFKVKDKFDKGLIFIIAICSTSAADVMAFQYLVAELKPTLKGIVDDVKVVPTDQLEGIVSNKK